jgi:hypothetical protein
VWTLQVIAEHGGGGGDEGWSSPARGFDAVWGGLR